MVENNEEVSFILIVFLLLIASASFYYQALVTEERFVPALNVISKRLRISDDVAGATLMAAGASSPELFAALVSVFITHSALGTGTVVGSEVCNCMVFNSTVNLLQTFPHTQRCLLFLPDFQSVGHWSSSST
jgi:Ca2+/Na+ antiporter